MSIRLIDAGWGSELIEAAGADPSCACIVSPYIKKRALERLLAFKPLQIKVITRFNLADFVQGVSDIAALRMLLKAEASVRGIRNLHAKVYLFGSKTAIVTSANLTAAALDRNHEFGIVAEDMAVILACRSYFDELWQRGGADLTEHQVDEWDNIVTRYRASGAKPASLFELPDYGANAGIPSLPAVALPIPIADASKGFVKFLGEGHNRAPLSLTTIEEVRRAGCHWAVAFPASKRPRAVGEGAIIFIGRLTRDPNDIRIFGRAIGMKHEPGRDDATPADIAMRPWKENWRRYIRVHAAEFVAGTMANGVSLSQLMDTLGPNTFASTQRNAKRNEGNTNPRLAYLQQAAVELSPEGLSLLSGWLQSAFERYGSVPQEALNILDWPILPSANPSAGTAV